MGNFVIPVELMNLNSQVDLPESIGRKGFLVGENERWLEKRKRERERINDKVTK